MSETTKHKPGPWTITTDGVKALLDASERLLEGISNCRSNLVSECSDLRDAIADAKLGGCGVPKNALCLFKDGDAWCATYRDFINLQGSPAGFGATWEEAATGLHQAAENMMASDPRPSP